MPWPFIQRSRLSLAGAFFLAPLRFTPIILLSPLLISQIRPSRVLGWTDSWKTDLDGREKLGPLLRQMCDRVSGFNQDREKLHVLVEMRWDAAQVALSTRSSQDRWRLWQKRLSATATAVGLLNDPDLDSQLIPSAGAIRVRLDIEGVRSLARHDLVVGLVLDEWVQARQPSPCSQALRSARPAGWSVHGNPTGNPDSTPMIIGHLSSGIENSSRFRIVSFRDFRNGRIFPYDDDGLGTFCASLIADPATGLAPSVGLLVGKVTGVGGRAQLSGLLCAMDWIASRTEDRPHLVFNSWSLVEDPSPSVRRLFARSVESWAALGIIGFFPAGDRGPETLDFPASHPSVIGVGSHDGTGIPMAYASRELVNWNALPFWKPDIFAPGDSIQSFWPGNLSGVLSGSAIACALATAAACRSWSLTGSASMEVLLSRISQVTRDGQCPVVIPPGRSADSP